MLTVHFLNVGHGECSLIAHPSGRLTMVDINTSHDYDWNYRGLCAAALLVAAIALVHDDRLVAAGLVVAAIIYLFRAYRFGGHYARELYIQFLLLPPKQPSPKIRR